MHRFRRSLVRQPAMALMLLAAVTVALPLAAAGASAAAATSRPAALFPLTISEIDRNGTSISSITTASVWSVNGVNYLSGGSAVAHVPAGTYIVGDRVWQASDGDTQTLVAKKVHVTGATNVTLDAQGAVPVVASVSAGGVTAGAQNVELCYRHGVDTDPVVGYQVDGAGTAYVKPVAVAGLQTIYQTYWQGPGTLYNLAGQFTHGIPATPSYHAQPSAMATVHVRLKDNENVTPLAAVIGSYGSCGSIEEPVTMPDSYTDFRTPGTWGMDLNFGSLPSHNQKDLFQFGNYLAGHTYSTVFGGAVYGPDLSYPEIDGHDVVYSPGNLFSDPAVRTSFDCEGKAGLTLHRGAALVKHQLLAFCTGPGTFVAHVAATGWCTLSAVATRFNPSGTVPGGDLLSTQVSMTWHFRFAPVTGHAINAQAIPVTVSRFLPQGLGPDNQATGGSTTTIKVVVGRGAGEPVPTPKYKLKTVRVQASFNGGISWQNLTATPQAGSWLVHVHNPGSGFVSLRSIVTDVHGDSTTETIIRAYVVG